MWCFNATRHRTRLTETTRSHRVLVQSVWWGTLVVEPCTVNGSLEGDLRARIVGRN